MSGDFCRSYQLSPSPSTEVGKTTISQRRVFENDLCQMDVKVGPGLLVTEAGPGPILSTKLHFGYENYGLTGYWDHYFPQKDGEPGREYLGAQPNYSIRWYPKDLWTQHADHVSTGQRGWYHRLRLGVPLGVTDIKDTGTNFHYGVSFEYSTAPVAWPMVETPLNLGLKFLATETGDKRDFSMIGTLDVSIFWGIVALISGGNYYNIYEGA